MINKIEKALKDFAHKVGTEAEETKAAGLIIKRHLAGEKISAADNKILKAQMLDILKGVGIGIPILLVPGASIIVPVVLTIAKKHGINLMPSAFQD